MDNFESEDNKKTANNSDSFESINLMRNPGLSPDNNYSKLKNIVKSKNQKVMEVRGIEPPSPWVIIQDSRQVTPMAGLLYQEK
ncbi:hypothetical protein COU23_03280 [Candidatus Kuenenbacteria bacterium CG10_big_fil_rev_8_21_14_0_10_36_11]|uniref:Uncharacterized protein n=1 Tax=Candidatus Kuenenbacteria bacterium CG10_big_fil_rev_8_21_14_0_10_36_11 TaxID=1974618 RepID=A0A2M6W9T7_9BACT|nr:MAG: hypothetical protein COU23_03280 [Candidatus Kuenenbacteria bacterium CG10_big_fil_rev_8_21_14_0_10_36_11]